MVEVYVLDGDLNEIGIIDEYVSFLWVSRYQSEGDCELYVEANEENLTLLLRGNYLSRKDDEMVCRIEKVELDTNIDTANFLIVTGYDVKKILSQRVIWGQKSVNGNVEDYIRNIVYDNLVFPNLSARQIKNSSGRANFFLGDKVYFTEVINEQVSYKKVSEKIQEICKKYGWGYKVIVDIGNFYFCLYKGSDRSRSVIFSNEYENLTKSAYIEDSSNLGNVALVAGEGEGSKRSRAVSGYAESLDRNEIAIDARDLSRNITWKELTTLYPLSSSGGQGYIDTTSSGAIVYKMGYINIAIIDSNQLAELKVNYPNGETITIQGNVYYRTYDAIIADLPAMNLEDGDTVVLRDIVYLPYLLTRGYEKLKEYGGVISFEGIIEPNVTFIYKKDYFLGDQVLIRNEYGIEVKVRIVEVMEVYDTNGYRIEPKFEYDITGGIIPPTPLTNLILTEDGQFLTTESGNMLELEGAEYYE